MRFTFTFFTIIILLSCNKKMQPTLSKINNNFFINVNGDTMLIGKAITSVLKQNPWNVWYDSFYSKYKVDTVKAMQTKQLLLNKKVDIFLGTWCGDSRREVPRMLKIFNTIGFDEKNVNLIFVDNADDSYKKSNKAEELGKNIHHVPTFIFYDNDKEIDRIVETPLETFEKDIATILSKLPYTPKYKAIEIWANRITKKDVIFDTTKIKEVANILQPVCKHSGELNAYGYVLLAQKMFNEAINIFIVNTQLYPTNANVFDSLGEAYFKTGNKELAKINYKKVLELEPENKNAIKMLEKLNN